MIPGTYNVGGRHVPKSTDQGRDSSQGINKAPGNTTPDEPHRARNTNLRLRLVNIQSLIHNSLRLLTPAFHIPVFFRLEP